MDIQVCHGFGASHVEEAKAFFIVNPLVMIIDTLPAIICSWMGFHLVVGDAVNDGFGLPFTGIAVVHFYSC